MEVSLRKLTVILISLSLIVIPLIQAAPVTADESPPVTTDELSGGWVGTVQIVMNYSYYTDTSWISEEEAKEQSMTFSKSPEIGKIYLGTPLISTYVQLDSDGNLEGYEHQTIPSSDRTHETDFYLAGHVSRSGAGLMMVLDITADSVTTIEGRSELRKNSFTYTYTMTPKNATAAPPTTTTPSATTEEPADFSTGKERGRVSFVQGKAFIQRSNRIIPVTIGEGLLPGDTISCEEGELVIEAATGGSLTIIEKTRFQIPEEKAVKKTNSNVISKIMGDIWTKTKAYVSKETFKALILTGACGVRG
jgi:hypothetical protein